MIWHTPGPKQWPWGAGGRVGPQIAQRAAPLELTRYLGCWCGGNSSPSDPRMGGGVVWSVAEPSDGFGGRDAIGIVSSSRRSTQVTSGLHATCEGLLKFGVLREWRDDQAAETSDRRKLNRIFIVRIC